MKRLFFVMTVLLTVTTTTKAASQAVLHNVYARQITSLNGNWQIVGMNQVTVLMEADDNEKELPSEILVP